MATGDQAAAAGMELVSGAAPANTIDTEINKTRDYIIEYGTPAVVPISRGGTGSTSAAGARTALGLAATVADVANATEATVANALMKRGTGGRVNVGAPVNPENATTKTYVDDGLAGKANRGGTPVPFEFGSRVNVNGDLTVGGGIYGSPNMSPATTNYTVAYINGDGRLSKGASSERYKKFISPIDPAALGNIWPDLHRYQMRQGETGAWKYGYIAERLDESDPLRPFVVYNADGLPDSIDFIALLIAQNAQLHQQLDALTTRLDNLEGNPT